MPILSLALCFYLFLSFPGPAFSEITKTVRVEGLGLIVDGDKSTGFEQAKRAALRQAVEEGVGVLISSQTRVQNFAIIQDDILSRTEGYIREFRITEHGPSDETTYQVEIEAVVGLGGLNESLDALDLLTESMDNPTIICLGRERLREKNGLIDQKWGLLASELRKGLRKANKHFHLAGPIGEFGGEAFDNGEKMAALGQDLGASIIVKGEAEMQPAAGIKVPLSSSTLGGIGIQSAVVLMRVEALWADSGEIFATLSTVENAAAVTIQAAYEKGIRNGAEKLTDRLVERLAEDWREKAYSGRLLRLVIEGKRERLTLFEREFPARIGGIEKLYPRSYSAGRGVYDARSQHTGFQVARSLVAREWEGMDIEVVQVTPNSLKLQLNPDPVQPAPE
jgi:hypothetical protein